MRLCIYCASSSHVDESYKECAKQAGQFCAEQGYEMVYGGGHVGLMGICADAALESGGTVIGVIPEFLDKKERSHKNLHELYITKTMQERQAKMAELSDAFLVLPGGLGTLAEFFEIVTWKQLGLHNKPIYILNHNNYWDDLLKMLNLAHQEEFLRQNLQELYVEIKTIEEIKL